MALSASMKKKLAAAAKKFKLVSMASGGGMVNDNVEDGNYSATLSLAELVEKAGKVAVVMTYDLVLEDGESEQVSARYWLETDQNLGYLKRDLARFGFEGLDDIDLSEDLEGLLEQLVTMDPICRVTVKTNDQWQNVYLNKVIEVNEQDSGNDSEEAVEAEEAEEEEEEEEEEELAELSKGSNVVVNYKGKDQPGVVKSIDEDAETVTVVLTALKKSVTVPIDKVELGE